MAIVLGTPVTVAANTGAGSVNYSLVAAGDDVFKGLVTMHGGGGAGEKATGMSMTFGGVACNAITGSPAMSPDGRAAVWGFYLLAADFPADGTRAIVGTPADGTNYRIQVSGTVDSGCAQEAPTWAEAAFDTATELVIPASDPPTVVDGGSAFAATVWAGDKTAVAFYPAPFTERWDALAAGSTSTHNGGDAPIEADGTLTLTTTTTTTARCAGAMIILDPVAVAPTGSPDNHSSARGIGRGLARGFAG